MKEMMGNCDLILGMMRESSTKEQLLAVSEALARNNVLLADLSRKDLNPNDAALYLQELNLNMNHIVRLHQLDKALTGTSSGTNEKN